MLGGASERSPAPLSRASARNPSPSDTTPESTSPARSSLGDDQHAPPRRQPRVPTLTQNNECRASAIPNNTIAHSEHRTPVAALSPHANSTVPKKSPAAVSVPGTLAE